MPKLLDDQQPSQSDSRAKRLDCAAHSQEISQSEKIGQTRTRKCKGCKKEFSQPFILPGRAFAFCGTCRTGGRTTKLTPLGRARCLISSAKARSKKLGREAPAIRAADLVPALERGVCQVSGLPFDFKPKGVRGHNPFSPSLDRIDNHKPYTVENTRVVCWAVNSGCGTWGLRVYLQIAAACLGVTPPP